MRGNLCIELKKEIQKQSSSRKSACLVWYLFNLTFTWFDCLSCAVLYNVTTNTSLLYTGSNTFSFGIHRIKLRKGTIRKGEKGKKRRNLYRQRKITSIILDGNVNLCAIFIKYQFFASLGLSPLSPLSLNPHTLISSDTSDNLMRNGNKKTTTMCFPLNSHVVVPRLVQNKTKSYPNIDTEHFSHSFSTKER